MRLIIKLIVGILSGIVIGHYSNDSILRAFITLKDLFGELIAFLIPLIILFFIVDGITNLDRKPWRILGLSCFLAYTSTVIAALLGLTIALSLLPHIISETGTIEYVKQSTDILQPYFIINIQPVTQVLTALGLAFVLGVGIALTKAQTLKVLFNEGKSIVELIIRNVIIPVLPLYVASIFAVLTKEGQVVTTLGVFGLVLLMAIVTHWLWLFIQFSTAGLLAGRNPLKLLVTMMPAYFTALGTMSSVATIPVTLRQVKENKVSNAIADYCVPLNASIHLSGSAVTIVLTAVAVMILKNDVALLSFTEFLPFIFLLAIAIVAAPGIPGGSIMASLGVLASVLGFNEAALGLMIVLYVAQDSFGTATNVTGDGALAVILDRFAGQKSEL